MTTGKKLSFLVLLVPVALFLPFLGEFVYPARSMVSDLVISHYPNAIFLRESILEWGKIPWWSSTILSGFPFAANPLSGLFYPPGWIALLFPLPLGFNLLACLHLVFGAIGIYLLFYKEGLGHAASLIGALAFEALPKVTAHYAAGHLTLVYAIVWTPWLLWAERIRREQGYRCRENALVGVCLGAAALADIRWAAYAGLVWAAYSLFGHFRGKGSAVTAGNGQLVRWIVSSAAVIFLGACIAAPVWLPLLRYTALTTRQNLTTADHLLYSLPPDRLLGFFFPDLGGLAEWMTYAGGMTIVLLVIVISFKLVRRRAAFWLGLIVISTLFSLGENFPGMDALLSLPGLGLLRVPSRALLATGVGLTAIIGYGINTLLTIPDWKSTMKFNPSLYLVGLAGLVSMMAVGVCWAAGEIKLSFVWGAGVLLIAVLFIILKLNGTISSGGFAACALAVMLLDLWGVNALAVQFRSASEVLGEGAIAAASLPFPSEDYRVYSPSYSLSQQTAAVRRLELADGIDPLQLAKYVAFMQKATGVKSSGYSVTLPAFASGDPKRDNQAAIPNAKLLGLLNVKFVVSEYPLRAVGLQLLEKAGTTHVYKNQYGLPRAWVQEDDRFPQAGEIRAVQIIDREPNRIRINANGTGRLVVAELMYPGWRVSVDGQPGVIEPYFEILRSVRLSEGAHQVVFIYRPVEVYASAGIALATWFVIGFYSLRKWKSRRI